MRTPVRWRLGLDNQAKGSLVAKGIRAGLASNTNPIGPLFALMPIAPSSPSCGAFTVVQRAPATHANGDCRCHLDPEQKSVRNPSPDSPEQAYRFRHSLETRARLLDLLPVMASNPTHSPRFAACGSDSWVEWSTNAQAYRLRSVRCGLRICPACQRAYAHRVAEKMADLFKHSRREPPKMVTLTLKPSGRELADSIRYLKSCFRRLRATTWWKSLVRYGVAVVEVTRGESHDHWHVHLHAVCWSAFIPWDELKRLWKRITCGSFIVNVRPCSDTATLTNYLTSYLTKAPDESVFASDDLAREWYRALTAQHWVIRFGSRKLLPPKKEPQRFHDWSIVCRLRDILPAVGESGWKPAALAYHAHITNRQAQEVIAHAIEVLDTA